MSYRLGLTGSIGMGKSTTAAMFADLGCAVWDADDAVRRLYAEGGAAIDPVAALVPEARQGGSLNRDALRRAIQENPDLLGRIEAIVHPLVRADRDAFAAQQSADILVFDIPLLFETGAEAEMDGVACVTVSPEVQQKRVLERGTMSAEDFALILSRQMPNADKVARADFVIETDTLDHARAQVQDIVNRLRSRTKDA